MTTSKPLINKELSGLHTSGSSSTGTELDSLDAKSMGVRPYNRYLAIAMTLNYVIGTGCFGLPYAFTESGLVLTTILMFAGAFFAFIAMNYTLEAMARAEGVFAQAGKKGGEDPAGVPVHQLTYHKLDFAQIGNIFMGKRGMMLVQFVMGLYTLSAMISYASVAASTMAALATEYMLPSRGECNIQGDSPSSSCVTTYWICMGVYAAIVLVLVVMDLGDQAGVQRVLTYYRLLAFFVLFVTMSIKLGHESSALVSERITRIGAFDFSKFAKGFGPSILAITCHYNMPDALQPLETKEHSKWVAFLALGLSCVFYLALGLLGAISFDDVNPLITLNWSDYTGFGNGWDRPQDTSIIGTAVKLFILFFPLVNVISTFPMVGVTIGDNLFPVFPQRIKSRLGVNLARKMCRLGVSIPPLLLALVFHRLDDILTIGGLFGFVITLMVPCMFQYYGSTYCTERWGPGSAKTPFSLAFWSEMKTVKVIFAISVVVTIVAVVTAF